MALFPDKFTVIKETIPTHPTQAQDECDNGVSQCVEAKVALDNVKNKLIERYPDDELISVDLAGAINEYFAAQ